MGRERRGAKRDAKFAPISWPIMVICSRRGREKQDVGLWTLGSSVLRGAWALALASTAVSVFFFVSSEAVGQLLE
jgi:hypothetical protein